MDDVPVPAPRRAPKRSRRVLLVDLATEPLAAVTKKARGTAPAFSPPVETPSAPARAPAISRAPDELVVVCTGVAGDSSALGRLAPSVRARAVHGLVGDIAELRRLRSGALVFVASTPDQVQTLLKQTSFCDIPVVMRPPRGRSSAVYGVLSGVEVAADPVQLRSALLASGATEYTRLQRRDSDGVLHDTRSLRVSFPDRLPDYVIFNYERLPVRPFVHRPLQCFNCQRYGHGAANCRSAPRCGKCSGPHSTRDCTGGAAGCAVCSGAHPAWSRDCPHRIRARRIESVRANEGLSYAAAVRRVPPVAVPPRAAARPPVTSVAIQTVSSSTAATTSADVATCTRDLPAPTSLPENSRMIVRGQSMDGPQMLLLYERDFERFFTLCLNFFRLHPSDEITPMQLADQTVDTFLALMDLTTH